MRSKNFFLHRLILGGLICGAWLFILGDLGGERYRLQASDGWLGGSEGNRLAYLDEPCDPFYPRLGFARLETPQWVGIPGVEAVVVLSIDDLREPARHEKYLRPILERLKAIDGRAPVSLMATQVPEDDEVIKRWLEEGLSIETHTVKHPCPLLQGGNLADAKSTFDQCIDNIARAVDREPVAFRMPCCDSMNSTSPRFFTEIFAHRTPEGRFLRADSSVFVVFTRKDPALPREWTVDEENRERFAKYIPPIREMANFVEDYPYPYVIHHVCWEIPALMPSDWNAQYLNGKASPRTLEDWKFALQIVVKKRGIWALCFHPYDWIAAEQVVELADYAAKTFGPRIRFMTFPEVVEALEHNLLRGHRLRNHAGQQSGVRLVDVNADGYMDVVIANEKECLTRVWVPADQKWIETGFPAPLGSSTGEESRELADVHFGVLSPNGPACALVCGGPAAGLWVFSDNRWKKLPEGLSGLNLLEGVFRSGESADRGIRLRDLNGDGVCELVVGNPSLRKVYRWESRARVSQSAGEPTGVFPSETGGSGSPATPAALTGRWVELPIELPEGVTFVEGLGRDAGLRLLDRDADRDLDLLFSDPDRWVVAEFISLEQGWIVKAKGKRGAGNREIPRFVRSDGTHNGVWFKFGKLWIQNEDSGRELFVEQSRIRIAADNIPLAELFPQ